MLDLLGAMLLLVSSGLCGLVVYQLVVHGRRDVLLGYLDKQLCPAFQMFQISFTANAGATFPPKDAIFVVFCLFCFQ